MIALAGDNARTVWAGRIREARQASEAVCVVGRLLIEAKDAIPHGQFGAMCKEAGLRQGAAQRLIARAEAIAIETARRIADGYLFEDSALLVAFKRSEPVYRMALRQCGSYAALREIVELARDAPQPSVVGALAAVILFIPEMDRRVDHLVGCDPVTLAEYRRHRRGVR